MRFPAVRLTHLTARALSVPTVDPFRIASGEVRATRSIAVEVTLRTEGGREASGLAEGACLPPVTTEDQDDALIAVSRSHLTGARFDDVDGLAFSLDAAMESTPVARSAVEVAILSALATLEGQPLWRWLSGERTGSAPPIESDITLPILAPERMATLATEWWGRGFRRFKVKVGRSLADDLRALEAIARATPGAQLQPDANGGLTAEEALDYARKSPLPVLCFEQPCETLEAMAEVARALEAPVLADESLRSMADLDAITSARAADGINLKIAKIGSLLRCLEIGRAAQARGMPLMVGGMVETSLGMTAATHLAAALGGVAFADLDTAWLLASDPFRGGYLADGPRYALSESPGLGIAWA